MAEHKALGRGLEALFSSNQSKPASASQEAAPRNLGEGGATAGEPALAANMVRQVLVTNIKPNRHQPRTEFDQASLVELAQSIRSHGLAQPLLVTETATPGEYEL